MKITAYVHAKYCQYEKKYEFKACSHDMSDYPDLVGVCVATHEFEIEEPPYEVLVAGTIKQYREEQQKILAEAEKQRQSIDQRINELLAIEYKPEESHD